MPDECDLRYERMDKLGEGTYGVVFKARDLETNEVSIVSHTIPTTPELATHGMCRIDQVDKILTMMKCRS